MDGFLAALRRFALHPEPWEVALVMYGVMIGWIIGGP